MIAGYYAKQPSEVETIKVDWSSRINSLGISGYAINAVEVKVYNSFGEDKTSDMIEGTPTFSGTDVIFTVKAGDDGKTYKARVKVTLTKSTFINLIQEDDLEIRVQQVGF